MQFVNGATAQFDKIVYCTGYKIDLPYFSEDLRNKTLDTGSNSISVSFWCFTASAAEPKIHNTKMVHPIHTQMSKQAQRVTSLNNQLSSSHCKD